MRFFRYGGVNVTYFIPKSSYRMDHSIDPATADRLSLPSVRMIHSAEIKPSENFSLVRERSTGRCIVNLHASHHVFG